MEGIKEKAMAAAIAVRGFVLNDLPREIGKLSHSWDQATNEGLYTAFVTNKFFSYCDSLELTSQERGFLVIPFAEATELHRAEGIELVKVHRVRNH